MVFSNDFAERHAQIPDYLGEIRPQFRHALNRITHASDELYLDGIKVYDVVTHRFLVQLNEFFGCGLCYEAAALAMFLLHDNPTARLVQGTAECRHQTHERCDHAWVEFYEDGVPFAVDFAWFESEFCVPRLVHVDIMKSLVLYSCSYQEFWSQHFTQDLFRLIHNRKTSYILPWLFLYRNSRGNYGLPLLKKLGEGVHRIEKYRPTGEPNQFRYFHEKAAAGKPNFVFAELRYVAT